MASAAASFSESELGCKQNYYEEVKSAARNQPQKDIMKRQWVNMITERILVAKEVVKTEGIDKLHPKVKETIDCYDVNGKYELVLKSSGSERDKVIVPLEESFETVMKAHKATYHGEVAAMEQWLKNANLTVAEFCLPILVEMCNDCHETKTLVKTEKIIGRLYRSVGLVNIIILNRETGNKVDTLLIYQDKKTEFLQLRLMQALNIATISKELVLLFSDMGPPECLVVMPALKNIFHTVNREKLNKFFSPNILIVTSKTDILKLDYTQIREACKTYKEMVCIGCHLIQWNMNNTRSGDGMTPFERVFGPKSGGDQTFDGSVSEITDTSHETVTVDTITQADVKKEPCDIDDYIYLNPTLEVPVEALSTMELQ